MNFLRKLFLKMFLVGKKKLRGVLCLMGKMLVGVGLIWELEKDCLGRTFVLKMWSCRMMILCFYDKETY